MVDQLSSEAGLASTSVILPKIPKRPNQARANFKDEQDELNERAKELLGKLIRRPGHWVISTRMQPRIC